MAITPPTPIQSLQWQINEQARQIDELRKQISLSTQEATKEKTQTKYRKNGALVFAPEMEKQY